MARAKEAGGGRRVVSAAPPAPAPRGGGRAPAAGLSLHERFSKLSTGGGRGGAAAAAPPARARLSAAAAADAAQRTTNARFAQARRRCRRGPVVCVCRPLRVAPRPSRRLPRSPTLSASALLTARWRAARVAARRGGPHVCRRARRSARTITTSLLAPCAF